jgi:DEAD/DEAH box helicase domain-containing protein
VDFFKKVQFHNHQNLGSEEIELCLKKELETEGLLLEIPKEVSDFFLELVHLGKADPLEYEKALAHVIFNAFLMHTMTSKQDVQCTESALSINGEVSSYIVIYDDYIGGLGFVEKGYEIADLILKDAIKITKNCQCKSGCPACTGSYKIDKKVIRWALESFFTVKEQPEDVEYLEVELPSMHEEKPFKLEKIASVWKQFIEIITSEEPRVMGSQFLQTIKQVKYENHTVILLTEGYVDKDWILSKNNKEAIVGLIKKYFNYDLTHAFSIDLETEKINELKMKIIGKRHNDIKKGL